MADPILFYLTTSSPKFYFGSLPTVSSCTLYKPKDVVHGPFRYICKQELTVHD